MPEEEQDCEKKSDTGRHYQPVCHRQASRSPFAVR